MKRWWVSASLIFLMLVGFGFYLPIKTSTEEKRAERYARIISLAPSYTETLLALEEEQRLVGVTIHCQGKMLKNVAKIGSFAEPSFEAIIALKPDLVLAVPHVMARPVLDNLRKNHIEVFAHQPDSLSDIKFIVAALAVKLDVIKKAEKINRNIDAAMDHAKNIVANRKLDEKNALIAVSHMPLVVAGKQSFPSEIIEALGLKNMALDPRVPWPVWPLENLLINPPEFFLIANGKEALPHYQKIFKNLYGMSTAMHLIVPDQPIFYSPSPVVTKDILHLADLLNSPFVDLSKASTWP